MAKAQAEADVVALQEKIDGEEVPTPADDIAPSAAPSQQPASGQPDGVLPPNDDGPAPQTLWGCSKCRHSANGCRGCNPGRFRDKPNQVKNIKKRPAASMD
jgi:hypothetical protein